VGRTFRYANQIERAARQDRLQRIEATFESLPFDAASARAYGRVYAAVVEGGRKARGRRAVDLLIAATAAAETLPLYTRNPDDFSGLQGVVGQSVGQAPHQAQRSRRTRIGQRTTGTTSSHELCFS
jgi:predicted nucleic acid-binding protein